MVARRWTPGELLTPAEAKDVLRVSRSALYRLAASGELPSVRVGKSLRIPKAGLHSYLDGLLLNRPTLAIPPGR